VIVSALLLWATPIESADSLGSSWLDEPNGMKLKSAVFAWVIVMLLDALEALDPDPDPELDDDGWLGCKVLSRLMLASARAGGTAVLVLDDADAPAGRCPRTVEVSLSTVLVDRVRSLCVRSLSRRLGVGPGTGMS
jgi:hypothetical protein